MLVTKLILTVYARPCVSMLHTVVKTSNRSTENERFDLSCSQLKQTESVVILFTVFKFVMRIFLFRSQPKKLKTLITDPNTQTHEFPVLLTTSDQEGHWSTPVKQGHPTTVFSQML